VRVGGYLEGSCKTALPGGVYTAPTAPHAGQEARRTADQEVGAPRLQMGSKRGDFLSIAECCQARCSLKA
jgi:hypothetical protein